METDLGNPIEYKPELDILSDEKHIQDDDGYYYDHPQQQMPQHHMMYMNPPPPPPPPPKLDILSNMDKNVMIVAFVVFLLGFFMGKTMQPVILRYT